MLPTFSGMISSNPSTNPNFFDWNTVYLPYCDAGSWAGDVDVPVVYNGTSLYFRGHRMLVEVYTQLKVCLSFNVKASLPSRYLILEYSLTFHS